MSGRRKKEEGRIIYLNVLNRLELDKSLIEGATADYRQINTDKRR
jgi:hypothetical protein